MNLNKLIGVNLHPETLLALEGQRALPLDLKILGGVAIYDSVSDRSLQAVDGRLDDVFSELRADKTSEYGACIAFVIDQVSEDDIEELDWRLKVGTKRQNHGLATVTQHSNADRSHVLWTGVDSSKEFKLLKHRGPIPLDDQSVRDGVVYSLTGTNLPIRL